MELQEVEAVVSNNLVKISQGYIYLQYGGKKFVQLYVRGNLGTGLLKIYNCETWSLNYDKFKALNMGYGNSKNCLSMYFNISALMNKGFGICNIIDNLLISIEFKTK